jgi:hypothetical protein
MLLRAMSQVEHASRTIGIHALVLDTLNNDAKRWYQSLDFGFQEIPGKSERLFVSTAFIRSLELGELTYEL